MGVQKISDEDRIKVLRCNILAGIILGPSILGRSKGFRKAVFPAESKPALETAASIGLMYYFFTIGVQQETSTLRRTGRKTVMIAIVGVVVPLIVTTIVAAIINPGAKQATVNLFVVTHVSMTGYSVVAQILADTNFLNTRLGKISLSMVMVNDFIGISITVLLSALNQSHDNRVIFGWVIISAAMYMVFMVKIMRWSMLWIIRHTPEGKPVQPIYIVAILVAVLVFGFTIEMIGVDAFFGAYLFGIIVPTGPPLGSALMEKVNTMAIQMLLPLYFVVVGLRTNLNAIRDVNRLVVFLVITMAGFMAKFLGTVVPCLFYKMTLNDSFCLGFFVTTKGLVDLFFIDKYQQSKILDEQTAAILTLLLVVLTAIIVPPLTYLYKPHTPIFPYTRRTIQQSKFINHEIRVLACVHEPHNVPSLISLLETTHSSKKNHLVLYPIHLVDLGARIASVLIDHNQPLDNAQLLPRSQSVNIATAFRNFSDHSGGSMTVQPFTAIAPFSSMHQEICNLAEDKMVCLVILPFHKQPTIDGRMQLTNPAFRAINQNVIDQAPCSVGILIERGIHSTSHGSVKGTRVGVVFFGGADDREALAFVADMAEHPRVCVAMLRFVVDEAPDWGVDIEEMERDEELVLEFREKHAKNNRVRYIERVMTSVAETFGAIKELGNNACDLIVVGREPPMLDGLKEWCESPELGPIGDLLASSDFSGNVSVIVLQQYTGMG